MSNVYALGVDPAKEKATLCLLDHTGKTILKPFDAPASKEGLSQVRTALAQVLAEGDLLFVGIEASASLDDNWLAFFSTMEEPYSLTVMRLDAAQVKHFSGPRPLRSKTDHADARRIAEFLRTYADRLDTFIHDPSANSMLLAVNDRMTIVCELTRLKNRLRDRLVIAFPEFAQVFNDPACPQALAVLEAAPTAAHLARKRENTIAALRAPEKGSHRVGEEKARQLLTLARNTIASQPDGYIEQAIRRLIEALRLAKRHLAEVDEILTTYSQTLAEDAQPEGEATLPEQIRLLDSIPGVGPVGASAIVLRSRGLLRFTSAKAFAAQLAACPDRLQTGSSTDTGRLGRRGDRRTRPLLFLDASAAARQDPAMAFHKWRHERSGQLPIQAICSIMNRLSRLMWTLVKNKTPYSPEKALQNIQIHHPELWNIFLKEKPQMKKKIEAITSSPALT